jgi:hypothetical protein
MPHPGVCSRIKAFKGLSSDKGTLGGETDLHHSGGAFPTRLLDIIAEVRRHKDAEGVDIDLVLWRPSAMPMTVRYTYIEFLRKSVLGCAGGSQGLHLPDLEELSEDVDLGALVRDLDTRQDWSWT